MNRTEALIQDMMVENTGRALGDSGDAYGRNWEKNREKGYPTETEYPIDFYVLENGIELNPSLNIYPYLTNTLTRTLEAEEIEQELYKEVGEENIWGIWTIEDVIKCSDFQCLFDTKTEYSWINTYNYMGIQSQTLQFLIFEALNTDYVLLQIHGGCDVRGGYTKPRVLEIKDLYEFTGNLDYMNIYCQCGEVDWDYFAGGYKHYAEDYNGNELSYEDIAEKTYVENGILKCEECGEPIFQTNPYF